MHNLKIIVSLYQLKYYRDEYPESEESYSYTSKSEENRRNKSMQETRLSLTIDIYQHFVYKIYWDQITTIIHPNFESQ